MRRNVISNYSCSILLSRGQADIRWSKKKIENEIVLCWFSNGFDMSVISLQLKIVQMNNNIVLCVAYSNRQVVAVYAKCIRRLLGIIFWWCDIIIIYNIQYCIYFVAVAVFFLRGTCTIRVRPSCTWIIFVTENMIHKNISSIK